MTVSTPTPALTVLPGGVPSSAQCQLVPSHHLTQRWLSDPSTNAYGRWAALGVSKTVSTPRRALTVLPGGVPSSAQCQLVPSHHLTQRWLSDPSTNVYGRWAALGVSMTVTTPTPALTVLPGGVPSSAQCQLVPSHHLTQRWLSDPSTNAYGRWAALGVSMTVTTPTPALTVLPGGVPSSAQCHLVPSPHLTQRCLSDPSTNAYGRWEALALPVALPTSTPALTVLPGGVPSSAQCQLVPSHHLTQRWLSDPSTNAYGRWAALGVSKTVSTPRRALTVLPGGVPSSAQCQLVPSHHLTQRWLSDPSTNVYGRWAALGVSMTVTTPTPALTVLPGGVPSSAQCQLVPSHHLTQRWLSDPSTNAYGRWAALGVSKTVSTPRRALTVLPGGVPSSAQCQLVPSHHLTQRWLSDPSTNAYGRWAALGVSLTVTTPTPALTVLPGGVPSSAQCQLVPSHHLTQRWLSDPSTNAYGRWAALGVSLTVTTPTPSLTVLPGGLPLHAARPIVPSHHLTQRWLSDPSTNAYGRWAALGVSLTVTTPTPALTVLPGGVPSSAQ